jgi:hypothetical protein
VLKASRKPPWSGAPDCPVVHRTVSGAPGGLALNSSASGFSRSRRAIIHRTVRCTPDSVRCSNGTRLRNSLASGFYEGCSAIIHRTCPVCTGLSGAFSEQRLLRRQRLPAVHLMRAQRAQKAGAPIPAHQTVNSSCPVRHRTSRRAQKSELQWSDSNSTDGVAGAPDMSGVHRTVRCTIEQTAAPTVKFGGWGYKYPNHPTIHCIQVFHFSTTYKSSSIQF